MTRREFMHTLGLGGIAAGAAALAPVRAAATATLRDAKPLGPPLGVEEERILALAALAPSGHNTQPWVVRISEQRRWMVGVDAARRLPAVDPADREIVLSIGAFIEHLAAAATALGLATEIERVASARDAPDLVSLRLIPARPGPEANLERIRRRRTLRRSYRDVALRNDHLDALLGAYTGAAVWFPAGSREAAWLGEAEIEAFRRQTWRDDAQAELSRWLRFSDGDVAGLLGPMYDVTRSGDAAIVRQRAGGVLFFAPATAWLGFERVRVYALGGVNLSDRNRRGKPFGVIGLGGDLDVGSARSAAASP